MLLILQIGVFQWPYYHGAPLLVDKGEGLWFLLAYEKQAKLVEGFGV